MQKRPLKKAQRYDAHTAELGNLVLKKLLFKHYVHQYYSTWYFHWLKR